MKKIKINVSGMSCAHCEKAVTNSLKSLDGMKSAKADAKKGIVAVEFDENKISLDVINAAIVEAGYEV